MFCCQGKVEGSTGASLAGRGTSFGAAPLVAATAIVSAEIVAGMSVWMAAASGREAALVLRNVRRLSMRSIMADGRISYEWNRQCLARLHEGLPRSPWRVSWLAEIQVNVVREAGERDLIAAGNVEAELAEAEIGAGLRPAIKDGPTVAVLDLVYEFGGADADLQRAETFLVAFIGNDEFRRFLAVANYGAVEVIVVHLEQDVVLGVGVVKHPLQEVPLGDHRGKNEGA